ncbi:MAG TPA: hypothetical protein VMU34_02485 [Mycobacterium sp.]|nr:hypothetical protein [Mycobacterium sp.]
MVGPQVGYIKDKLYAKFEWARQWPGFAASHDTEGQHEVYDEVTRDVVEEFQKRTGMIGAGTATAGIANYATQVRLGAWPPPPPPTPPRHACLTFRGFGGVVGLDYTSRVAQACAARVEEVPIDYPASMGGIPGGVANDPNAPSGNDGVKVAIELAPEWFAHNPTRTFVLGAYSLGAIAASHVRAELEPGGRFADYKSDYVCGFTFGNPCRAFGHTFYLGAIPNGHGISAFQLPESCCTWDWCDEANPGDIYTNVPLGDVGKICTDAYGIVMDTTISDPIGTARKLIPQLLKIVHDAGVKIPFLDNLGDISQGALGPELIGLLLSVLTGVFASIGGGGRNLTGPAAAVQAAIMGLRFYGDNLSTRPHIIYEFEQAMPGQSHLDHAIQHVNDWAKQVSVRT